MLDSFLNMLDFNDNVRFIFAYGRFMLDLFFHMLICSELKCNMLDLC